MMRWIRRVAIALLAAFVAIYVGDLGLYKMRGSPSSTVTVNRYLTVPLKGNKIEYDYLGTAETACALALFPQAGLNPCWYVRRHPNQNTDL